MNVSTTARFVAAGTIARHSIPDEEINPGG